MDKKNHKKGALWHWFWQTLYSKSSSKHCSRWDNAHVVAQWVCAIFWSLKCSYYMSPLSLCKWGKLLGVWAYLCTACTALEHRLGHSARETGQTTAADGTFAQISSCQPHRLISVIDKVKKALVDKDKWKSLQRFPTRHSTSRSALGCSPVMSGDVRCTKQGINLRLAGHQSAVFYRFLKL